MAWVPFSISIIISSPISIAVYMTAEESSYFDLFLKNTPLPHRLRLIQYRVLPPERAKHHCVVYYDEVSEPFASSSGLFHTTDQWGKNHTYVRHCENYKERIYPINRLRNLAIQNIITTHFLVLDMDMWPIGAFLFFSSDLRIHLSRYHHSSHSNSSKRTSCYDSPRIFPQILGNRRLFELPRLCGEGDSSAAPDEEAAGRVYRPRRVHDLPSRDSHSRMLCFGGMLD